MARKWFIGDCAVGALSFLGFERRKREEERWRLGKEKSGGSEKRCLFSF